MRIEVTVPDEWTPGLTLAMQQLLQHAVRNGYPSSPPAPGRDAEQIQEIDHQIRALVRELRPGRLSSGTRGSQRPGAPGL